MNRHSVAQTATVAAKPRSRGDEPIVAAVPSLTDVKTPLTRG